MRSDNTPFPEGELAILEGKSEPGTVGDAPRSVSDVGTQSDLGLGKKVRDWTLWGLALLGSVLGLLGFLEARRVASKTRTLEVQRQLDVAWDLLGGELGTEYIANTTTDRSQLELARRLIVEVLALEPQNPKARRLNSVYLWASGRKEEAEAVLRDSLQENPQSSRSFVSLGVLLVDQGRIQEAVKAFRNALAIDPSDAIALHNLGVLHHVEGRHQDAVEFYEKAVAANPGLPDALYKLGLALREQGKSDEATMKLQEAYSMDSEVLSRSRAYIYDATGNLLRVRSSESDESSIPGPVSDSEVLSRRRVYIYDATGNLIRVRSSESDESSIPGSVSDILELDVVKENSVAPNN